MDFQLHDWHKRYGHFTPIYFWTTYIFKQIPTCRLDVWKSKLSVMEPEREANMDRKDDLLVRRVSHFNSFDRIYSWDKNYPLNWICRKIYLFK